MTTTLVVVAAVVVVVRLIPIGQTSRLGTITTTPVVLVALPDHRPPRTSTAALVALADLRHLRLTTSRSPGQVDMAAAAERAHRTILQAGLLGQLVILAGLLVALVGKAMALSRSQRRGLLGHLAISLRALVDRHPAQVGQAEPVASNQGQAAGAAAVQQAGSGLTNTRLHRFILLPLAQVVGLELLALLAFVDQAVAAVVAEPMTRHPAQAVQAVMVSSS